MHIANIGTYVRKLHKRCENYMLDTRGLKAHVMDWFAHGLDHKM